MATPPITNFFFKRGTDAEHAPGLPSSYIAPQPTRATYKAPSTVAPNPALNTAGHGRTTKNYSAKVKEEVALYAMEHGIVAACSKYCTIPRTTIRNWVAKAERFRQEAAAAAPAEVGAVDFAGTHALADGRSWNGRRLPDALMDALFDWFHAAREAGLGISRLQLRARVLKLVTDMCPGMLACNGGWLACQGGMLRELEKELNLGRRVATTAKRGSVDSVENIRTLFIARVAYICNAFSIPKRLVFHMDETGVKLLPVSQSTLNVRGAKAVAIRHSDDKRQVTCVVAGDLDGSILPGQVIFAQGAAARLPKVSGLHTTTSENHWAQPHTTIEWLETVLRPAADAARAALQLPPQQHALLLWDVYASHRCEEERTYIADALPWLKLVFVPANCTGFLQPADVSLNKPFKTRVRQLAEHWLAEQYDAGKIPDLRIRNLRHLAAEWMKDALSYLATTDAAENGLRRIGLHTCWRADIINQAQAWHKAGHLWKSHSPNDVVALAGEVASAAVRRSIPPPQVEVSDDEAPHAAAAQVRTVGTKRKRVFHCSFCKKPGHTKPTCERYKDAKAARKLLIERAARESAAKAE